MDSHIRTTADLVLLDGLLTLMLSAGSFTVRRVATACMETSACNCTATTRTWSALQTEYQLLKEQPVEFSIRHMPRRASPAGATKANVFRTDSSRRQLMEDGIRGVDGRTAHAVAALEWVIKCEVATDRDQRMEESTVSAKDGDTGTLESWIILSDNYDLIRTCNTQNCNPEAPSFREKQCSRYDSKRFSGKFYDWVPHTSAKVPSCSLTCKPKVWSINFQV